MFTIKLLWMDVQISTELLGILSMKSTTFTPHCRYRSRFSFSEQSDVCLILGIFSA